MPWNCSAKAILGDPGAVSGAGDKVKTGGKKFDEQKVQTKNRSPWGQTLYGPVPNGRANTRSWLGRKPFVFFCPIGGQQRLKTIWCVLTRRITTRLLCSPCLPGSFDDNLTRGESFRLERQYVRDTVRRGWRKGVGKYVGLLERCCNGGVG